MANIEIEAVKPSRPVVRAPKSRSRLYAHKEGSSRGLKKHGRSIVSNGNRLFSLTSIDGQVIDGRSSLSRRFRDLIDEISHDLGGPDLLSEGQRQLIRRAATLCIMAEAIEADCVLGLPFDAGAFSSLTYTIGRVLLRLGINKQLRNVTPSERTGLLDMFRKPHADEELP